MLISMPLYRHPFLHVNICNPGLADKPINVTECAGKANRADAHSGINCLSDICISWGFLSRLNLMNCQVKIHCPAQWHYRNRLLLMEALKGNGLWTPGCSQAVRSAMNSCIPSGVRKCDLDQWSWNCNGLPRKPLLMRGWWKIIPVAMELNCFPGIMA